MKKPKISLIAVICMVLICAIVAGCAAAGSTGAQQNPEKDPPATTTPTSTPETSPATNPTTKPTDPEPTEPTPTDPIPTEPQPTEPKPTDPQPTEPQPTEPQPTEPQPTDPEPTDPPRDDLAEFNALFGDWRSWYNRALTSEYTTPKQINLEYLFYLGFADEPRDATDAELAELKAQLNNPDLIEYLEIIRLPVEKMNQVLQDYFGITLDDVDDAGFDGFYYLESTNCYYLMHTDAAFTENFNAISVEYMEDGAVRVYYTANWEDTVYVVTLMPHGDGYRILSNVALSAPPEPEPEPTISDADKALYDRAIAALDAYAGGAQAHYYDENGEYYDEDALWAICALLIRLEDYGESAAYLQNFSVQNLLISESWKYYNTKLGGALMDDYYTKENTGFAYDEMGRLTKMHTFEVFRGIFFTPGWYLEFSYADGRLDHYSVGEDGDVYCTVYCIYDDAGHLVEEKLTGGYEFSIYYSYDDAGRLSAWEYTTDNFSRYVQEYTYDAQGRLLQTNRYTYLDPMEMGNWKLKGTQTADYVYGENGLLQSIVTVDYSDYVTQSTITTTFIYDDSGVLVSKTMEHGPILDADGNVIDTISVRKEEVTYHYETNIFYTP